MLIPYIGFVGSAVATLICYFSMTILSFIFARKHYPIPYNYSRILLYFSLMISIFIILYYTSFTLLIDVMFILVYLLIVYVLEKPKAIINSTPKLF